MTLPTSQDEAAALAIIALASAIAAMGRLFSESEPLTIRHAIATVLGAITLAMIAWGGINHFNPAPIGTPLLIAFGCLCGRFTDLGYSMVRRWIETQAPKRKR